MGQKFFVEGKRSDDNGNSKSMIYNNIKVLTPVTQCVVVAVFKLSQASLELLGLYLGKRVGRLKRIVQRA